MLPHALHRNIDAGSSCGRTHFDWRCCVGISCGRKVYGYVQFGFLRGGCGFRNKRDRIEVIECGYSRLIRGEITPGIVEDPGRDREAVRHSSHCAHKIASWREPEQSILAAVIRHCGLHWNEDPPPTLIERFHRADLRSDHRFAKLIKDPAGNRSCGI